MSPSPAGMGQAPGLRSQDASTMGAVAVWGMHLLRCSGSWPWRIGVSLNLLSEPVFRKARVEEQKVLFIRYWLQGCLESI